LTDCEKFSSGTDLKPELKIKMQYRWAFVFAKLRDYKRALTMLQELKKFCNIYEQFDLWK